MANSETVTFDEEYLNYEQHNPRLPETPRSIPMAGDVRVDSTPKSFFRYNEAQNKSYCLVAGCKDVLSSCHTNNFRRHLLRRHSSSFTAEELGCIRMVRKRTAESANVEIGKIKRACVELVTINGRPFTLVEDSGFRKIISVLSKCVAQPLRLTRFSVTEDIAALAETVRDSIRDELKGRMISLKMDGVSRHSKRIFGDKRSVHRRQ